MSTVLAPQDLEDFAARVLAAAGAPEVKAKFVAKTLIAANLRGVDSHGVQLLPHYVDQIEAGDVDPDADGHVVSESGACLLYDGEHGFGAVVSEICCGNALRLADEHGLGLVVARDSSHFGAAAVWAQRISAAGDIGIVMCDASPLVPPWQGKQGRVGTNPIAMSVPHPDYRGWLLDMATTAAAYGKLEAVKLKGQTTLPAGWALDSEGRPTTDLNVALKGLLMPLGGYKGSGLALMVEILTGALSGGAMASEICGIRQHGKPSRVNQTFLAIEVARFMPVEEFHARMARLVDSVKSAQPAAGYDEVLVAGEPEWRTEDERARRGIPIPDGPWRELLKTAGRLGVAPPEARQL